MSSFGPDTTGIDAIRFYSECLAVIAEGNPPSTPVPTCGGWTLGDLTWHMAEVQNFWSFIISSRPVGPADYDEPSRPADQIGLVSFLREQTADLLACLDGANPEDLAWSWSEEQTVAFTLRRQSHEALIHHCDAVLAVDEQIPAVSATLASDGIDEIVNVVLAGLPAWARFTPGIGAVTLAATDTGDSWSLAFGRMTGTSPDSGKVYDIDSVARVEGVSVDATIAGPALAVDLWLWGRCGIDELEVEGDTGLVDHLRAITASGVQ